MRLLRKRNELISALSALSSTSIIDTKTGEYVTQNVLSEKIALVMTTVLEETERLYEVSKDSLLVDLEDYSGSPQAAEFARQKGYKTDFRDTMPRGVLAVSRLEKLVQFKLISETDSYVKNPTPNKKEHTFGKTINLGAVDKQMAELSLDGNELSLLWKCWDREYYITFQIPSYVLKRDIVKFSLPLVKENKKTGDFEFIFNLFEAIQP